MVCVAAAAAATTAPAAGPHSSCARHGCAPAVVLLLLLLRLLLGRTHAAPATAVCSRRRASAAAAAATTPSSLASLRYIVTYGLGIYLLNNFIGFLSPMIDPENEGPTLPTSGSEEYRPFSRRLPEFKFWCVAGAAAATPAPYAAAALPARTVLPLLLLLATPPHTRRGFPGTRPSRPSSRRS